jgi:site-specific recombinase XerD
MNGMLPSLPALVPTEPAVPALVTERGEAARFAWEEFFDGEIANDHTRRNYLRAVRRFLNWAEDRKLELVRITPGDVGRYFRDLSVATPTKKLHLAALRKFFDRLVTRHIVVINPAATVRAERHSVQEGRTPEISPEQVRTLLVSLDTSTLMGLRDLAVLAILVYTAARVGAVAKLSIRDLTHDGTQYSLRFAEKGGKIRDIPVRHDLERFLRDYIRAAEITEGPLFRTVNGWTGKLTTRPMTSIDICRMMKRRLRDAGLPNQFSPHSFRVATVTDLLEQHVPLEDVQYLAGHADPRTTRLYDRRRRRITRNIVERISIQSPGTPEGS